jgi:ribosomal protein S12 methylthiotransferase accessory factor
MRIFGKQASAPKGWREGSHRTRAPEATLAAYRGFLPAMGITRLASVGGLDRIGLPVCVAIRPNARSLATAQGKGETLAAAKVSAMMEAIESWHGERVGGPVWIESYSELARQRRVADPRGLPLRADAAWYPDRPIEWIEGEDLIAGGGVLVPYETVSTNYVELPGRPAVFLKSSNGLASGNHPVEAVLHGLLEVVERDALALFNLLPAPARKARQIDLATVRDPHLRGLVDTLAGQGIALAAWDITSDTGIPAYTCTLIEDPDSPYWRPVPAMSGHGAHLVPRIALSRAVHEAIQSRVTVISGSRDDMFPRDYHDAGGRAEHARTLATWREPAPTRAFTEAGPAVGDTLEQDLSTVLAALQACGIGSAVVVDLSVPQFGIPVVKVVVPGLEPFGSPVYRPGPRARAFLAGIAA